MRIVIGSFQQESNTFSPVKTELRHFKENYLLFGREIKERLKQTATEVSGFISVAQAKEMKLVPTLATQATSSGRVTTKAFKFLKNKLLEGIEKAGKIDGVLLALHGSMVVEDLDDGEGELLKAVRDLVGPSVPIVVTLDLHANVTSLMVESADILVGYDTYPHIDLYETGEKAANIMYSLVKGEIKPTLAWKKIPMVVPPENMQTTHGPMARIVGLAKRIEKRRKVISTSVFGVQPWLDIKEFGWSVIVVTDNDPELAKREATKLAQLVWSLRKEFNVKLIPLTKAIEEAMKIKGGPVIFAHSADSVSSGSPGDNTTVLKGLLESKVKCSAALTLVDPEAVKEAIKAGIGKEVTLKVGGKRDKLYSKPVKIRGIVKRISDGKFIFKGPAFRGVEAKMGRTVVLDINGINLVLSEIPVGTFDPELYRSLGIEPKEMKIVVVKSPNLFRAAYEPLAKKIILLDAPGFSNPKITSYKYKNIERPMYPFDKRVVWP